MSSSPDAEKLRLTTADFDAYLPERATSDAFTGPRHELKQRMLAWSRGVVVRLGEIAIPVEVTGSDEHPSARNGQRVGGQHVFFWRDAEARAEIEGLIDRKRSLAALGDPAPHEKHAFLALGIDTRGVEVSVELHPDAWVDAKNLRARLADPGAMLELTSALEALPEQFTVGLAGPAQGAEAEITEGAQAEAAEARSPAAHATSESVREIVDRAEREGRALWIGWTIPRDVAVTHSELLDEQLEDAIVALGPLQKLIAWAPDNDRFDLARELEAAKADRARVHAEAERDRVLQARRDREGEEARARAQERDEQRGEEPGEPEPEPSVLPRSPLRPGPGLPPRATQRLMVRRAGVGMVTEVDPDAPIEKGTRVRVLAGPFRGKIGVVQEIDARGAARVILGLLATRVDVKNLIASAEGKDRPALASSHRKPIGVRS